jgi:16S rRNA (adenine1518-N6/adenine1519-N6)-dimethyltransferase
VTARPAGAGRADGGRPTGAGRPPAARRYGQHHLVDRGTLDAIVKMAGVQADEVVLEVGAADGLLTRPLLAAAAHVHAYEVDLRFAASLERLSAERPALTVHLRDALRADFAALDPAPTVFAANLAYNIAIPVIMKSLQELPGLRRWAVMVQKELGERLFARPSTKPYSAVSVQVQQACRPLAGRPIPRSVFSPRPRVDSLFVVFERDEEAPDADSSAAVQRLVRAAFMQRRKMLANSLSGLQWRPLAPPVGDDAPAALPANATAPVPAPAVLSPDDVRRALAALDLSVTARPEELTPRQLLAVARRLGRE